VLFGIFSTWLTSRDDKRHGNRQRLNSRADNGLCPNAAAKPKLKLRLRAKWRGSSRHTHTNYSDYCNCANQKSSFTRGPNKMRNDPLLSLCLKSKSNFSCRLPSLSRSLQHATGPMWILASAPINWHISSSACTAV
jgi:hypothetical protein